ncbi:MULTISPECIES: hypothetical protein [Catenuloplanes]|uniref:Uncharacterized protein n=1 Tax=Catenuloplanes niger TaxID=587534 RepID=A0AAE4CYK2_9ACTN|nr:hypothetical protein [Catenuloplanes niger]MDR7327673.1 hypothetical protein [Catenuloplanes niger]
MDRYRVEWRPGHGVFSLRDVDCDAGVGASRAIEKAHRDVAAGTGLEVWIARAQDMFKVAVEVQTWTSRPGPGSTGVADESAWSAPLSFRLECPTGELLVSDASSVPLTGIAAPAGPGHYRVEVLHRGRADAVRAYREHIAYIDGLPVLEQVAYLDVNHVGVEAYLLRLFPRGAEATR